MKKTIGHQYRLANCAALKPMERFEAKKQSTGIATQKSGTAPGINSKC
jgi:hypothetical protein